MIAAANPHAAQAGLDMMRAGGSAVDAAIAAQMVLGLVEPESSAASAAALSCWSTIPRLNAKPPALTAANWRPPPPRPPCSWMPAASPAIPIRNAIPGGLSVGIPGVVRMLALAHKKYGKLPWAKLFEPAIKLAEDGFPVGPKLARTIKGVHVAAPATCPTSRRISIMPTARRWSVKANLQEPRICRQTLKQDRQGRPGRLSTRARSPRRSSTRCSMRPRTRAA